MAFWSGGEINRHAERFKIVTPFRQAQIDCSAYTLCMGAEYYITPSANLKFEPHTKQHLHPKSRLVSEENEDIFDESGERIEQLGGTFQIPPGQFGFLLTEEFVRMPSETMGFISLKSSAKFKGLINVSGFHVDPGFEGHLIFSVFNAGPSTITFQRGQPLFLIWFADLEGNGAQDFADYARKGKPPLVEISPSVVGNVHSDMVSLESLAKRIDNIDPQVTIIKIITYAISTALIILISLLALTNIDLTFSISNE